MRGGTLVGILADTHGVLDPRVLSLFRTAGVAHIIHAGDLCDRGAARLPLADIVSSLKEIAPLTVVRGNTDDKHCPSHGLPPRSVLRVGAVRFHVHHGDDGSEPLEMLRPSGGSFGHAGNARGIGGLSRHGRFL